MVLKCPFKSKTRNQQRYLDTIQWLRLDEAKHTSYTKNAASFTYDTYAHFDDSEDNIYPYSYCDIDETFFTGA
jgi:hypothetical protein